MADSKNGKRSVELGTRALHEVHKRPRHDVDVQSDVGQALKSGDFEQVILTASTALEHDVGTKRKHPEVRRNLLWARAKAYKAKDMLDCALADARRALKLFPDDPDSYVRTANILMSAGHKEQALDCLSIADQKVKHCKPEQAALQAKRIEKQRRMINQPSTICYISRLPDEILLIVFEQGPSLNTLGTVCRQWRHLLLKSPSMWRQLILSQDLTASQCVDALNVFTLRSNVSLEVIEMPNTFLRQDPRQALIILRQNAETLRHIKMPSMQQETCHHILYSHCTRLESLDIAGKQAGAKLTTKSSNDDLHDGYESPFRLAVFKGDWGATYGHSLPKMDKLRVIHNLDHHSWRCNQWVNFILAIAQLSDTLEEWILFNESSYNKAVSNIRRIGRQDLVGEAADLFPDGHPARIKFTRLKLLQGWNIGCAPSFVFPALEVAKGFKYARSDNDTIHPQRPILAFFQDSPHIRELEIDLTENDHEELAVLIAAISRLEDLEDLTLTRNRDVLSDSAKLEGVLAPTYQRNTATGEYIPHVPCRRLKRLSLRQKDFPIDTLIRLLALRNYLALGHTFKSAQDMAQKKIGRQVTPRFHRSNPFQRGSTISAPLTPASTAAEIPIAAQSARFELCRLESIELWRVQMPEEALEALHELADTVNVRYEML